MEKLLHVITKSVAKKYVLYTVLTWMHILRSMVRPNRKRRNKLLHSAWRRDYRRTRTYKLILLHCVGIQKESKTLDTQYTTHHFLCFMATNVLI